MGAKKKMGAQEEQGGQLLELWGGWGSERNDTRAQVGASFEKMYSHTGIIGFILKDEAAGTLALYGAWNGSRQDTRTQVGPSFETGYSTSGVKLGYIFDKKHPGTVELWSGWSSKRRDTRVQVGNQFESLYGHHLLLGHVLKGEVEVKSTTYHFDQINVRGREVDQRVSVSQANPSAASMKQTIKKSFTTKKSSTYRYEETEKWGITLAYHVNAGIEIPVKGEAGWKTEVTYEQTRSFVKENYVEFTAQTEFETEIDIPPYSNVKGDVVLYKAMASIPFTIILGIKGSDRNEDRWELKGTCEAVDSYEFESDIKNVESLKQ